MNKIILFSRNYGILLVTVALFFVLATTTDGFFTERNMRNILDQQSGVLIAAVFMTMVIISGNFDISVAAIFVAAPLFAIQALNATGSIPIGIGAGLLAGLVMGSINAIVVTRFQINSFIATLATSFMFLVQAT